MKIIKAILAFWIMVAMFEGAFYLIGSLSNMSFDMREWDRSDAPILYTFATLLGLISGALMFAYIVNPKLFKE